MGKIKLNKSKFLILERGKSFTQTKLAEHLNKAFGSKKSGSLFTVLDINKYVKRGYLPAYLGANSLTIIEDQSVGIKLIEVGDPVSTEIINKRTTK